MANEFLIKKLFHFHAAHRNEDLPEDRCFSIHGHTYHVACHFAFEKADSKSVTMLFSAIEKAVSPVLERFEHSFIINRDDPLYSLLKDVGIKLCVLEHPSSAENLARLIFEEVRSQTGLNLVQIDFQETLSSVVSYRGEEGFVREQ